MQKKRADWILERIHKHHDRKSFSCGKSELDTYLRHFARQNDEHGIGCTYVAVQSNSNTVAGYFTLSTASIEFVNLPKHLAKGIPKYPIPCVLIGKLAVARDRQGQGIGRFLLWEALRIAFNVAQEIAIFLVVVDALDEDARQFYLHNGFEGLKEDRRRLAVSVKAMRQLLSKEKI